MWRSLLIIGAFFGLLSCSDDAMTESLAEEPEVRSGCPTDHLLENFTDTEGNDLYIYADGQVFSSANAECRFELQYFDPGFEAQNYTTDSSGTFLRDDHALVPVKNDFSETFEAENFNALFPSDRESPSLFWTNFTLQSPMAKTVDEYVALSKCILNGSCDFLDNTIRLIEDPEDSTNQVIEFTSVAPTADMVTSKCSLSSVLGYFKKNTDLWFAANYFIKSGMPYSIVDFENAYFEGSPGPRVVIRDKRLEVENKFGAKDRYTSGSVTEVPLNQWFTVKVHLRLSNETDGVIELWQDGVPLISATGVTLPTSNAIQNIIELGISATQRPTVLLVDDMRISNTEF